MKFFPANKTTQAELAYIFGGSFFTFYVNRAIYPLVVLLDGFIASYLYPLYWATNNCDPIIIRLRAENIESHIATAQNMIGFINLPVAIIFSCVYTFLLLLILRSRQRKKNDSQQTKQDINAARYLWQIPLRFFLLIMLLWVIHAIQITVYAIVTQMNGHEPYIAYLNMLGKMYISWPLAGVVCLLLKIRLV